MHNAFIKVSKMQFMQMRGNLNKHQDFFTADFLFLFQLLTFV